MFWWSSYNIVYLLLYLLVSWMSRGCLGSESSREWADDAWGFMVEFWRWLVSSEVRGDSGVRAASYLGAFCHVSEAHSLALTYLIQVSYKLQCSTRVVANMCHILCHLGYVGFPSG